LVYITIINVVTTSCGTRRGFSRLRIILLTEKKKKDS
jgi:hypothetical protein